MDRDQNAETRLVDCEVDRILGLSPAYHQLDAGARAALATDMKTVAQALAAPGAPRLPLARQLAPDLSRLRPNAERAPSPDDGRAPAGPVTTTAAPSGAGPTGRVGEVARATLNAIDFPQFVASLIQGTFQAIVDASIQQMEAYAELLKNVAGTVDQFMRDNISDGTARDYLGDQYDGFLQRDTGGVSQPKLRVNPDADADSMPTFFSDLGFSGPEEIDDDAMEQVVVPAARRSLAEQRQQTLATMVLMGINRVVVDDGELTAKLQFHIDASETTNLRFDQTKVTSGNMAGRAGRSPFTANAIMVNTANLNAQSDLNVRADLTGQVKVRFRSETFPLERFADSAAIQLINQNAKVPPPTPPAAATATPDTAPSPVLPGGTPGAPAAAVPSAGAAPTPAAQSLAYADPWAPRSAG
ncbi:MAG TPA: hypothetical protein VH482_34955 [Thermomicrobiales bacterium]|jgi:hypothetical protein